MKVVALTGAGISRESGLQTFRDGDGLWEGHRVEEVATPEAYQRDPELVQRFYDERRAQARRAEPNAGHRALAELEQRFEVQIITQNIDDLHERAGSSNVLHLHGEIIKAQSELDSNLVYPIEGDVLPRDARCELGSPLRPHVVWFGEAVPALETAAHLTSQADVFLIVGTSLVVYPAAGLVNYATQSVRKVLIDPAPPQGLLHDVEVMAEPASVGVPKLVKQLLA